MITAFKPIALDDYIQKHLAANPGDNRTETSKNLKAALRAFKAGVKCSCGNPIWVIGSAFAGQACFTCITGQADAGEDYEIDEACSISTNKSKP